MSPFHFFPGPSTNSKVHVDKCWLLLFAALIFFCPFFVSLNNEQTFEKVDCKMRGLTKVGHFHDGDYGNPAEISGQKHVFRVCE